MSMLLSTPSSSAERQMRRRRRKSADQARSLSLLLSLLLLLPFARSPMAHARSVRQQQPGTEEDVLVQTPLGKVRGFRQKVDGKPVLTYLGVPYAQRPVGSRRFAVPQMVDPWEDELVAQTPARTCFNQVDTTFPDFPGAEMWNPPNELDEDCLNMNIWVPDRHDGTVLVWIYGGGFYSGSPSLDVYDGRVLAAQQEALVVNINYRLGPFGFLYLGDDTAVPGNMGLRDQQLALRWIHLYIVHFGGDPQRVTLFGESAGGASATAHLFAPDSHPLFQRLIAMSGVIVNNWASKPKKVIRRISYALARRLNCTQLSGEESPESAQVDQQIVPCLARVSAQTLQRESDALSELEPLPMNFMFVPIDEDQHFFRGSLFDRLRRREFKKNVSILLGTVRDEGTYWLPYYLQKHGFGFNHTISPEDQHNQALLTEHEYMNSFDAFIPYFGNSQLVRHALMHAYSRLSPEHSHSAERWRDGVGRFLGDYFFTCAIIEFADIVSEEVFDAPFMYYLTKRSSANPWPRWMGVMHGYEIEYAFGLPLRSPQQYDPKELESERIFSERIMEFWGRFARTGVPVDFWPKYNHVTRKSLVLSDEIARGNSHRIYVDVHGRLCRLLEEAQAVVRLNNEQRHARLSDRGRVKLEVAYPGTQPAHSGGIVIRGMAIAYPMILISAFILELLSRNSNAVVSFDLDF